MAPQCEIKFDNNPLGIYHAGQKLAGQVELRLDKSESVNGFRLIISGYAEVNWSERDDEKSEQFHGIRKLLRSESTLIAPREGGSKEIPEGTHVFKFCCALPSNLPTSFQGEFGMIRYTVCAILDRPWKFNQTCAVAFTVLKPLDLNRDPVLGQPKRVEVLETFCCWPCRSRPLQITVEIPASGYVPGQKIPVTVTLNNASSVTLHGIKCSLQRDEYYFSETPYAKSKTVRKTFATASTTVTNDVYWRTVLQLDIPSIAPTGECSILTMEYELIITVKVGSCRINPKIQIPITIGTVPLATTTLRSSSSANYGSFDECQPPTAALLASTDYLTEPPSYEEAVHGVPVNVNDDPHAIGSQSYVPRYPVYLKS